MANQTVSLLQASERLLNSNATSPISEQQEQQTAKALFAYQRATIMYKCWSHDAAADADTFIDAAAAILAGYSEDIIVSVTDPRIGIACRQKWRVQPSEVKEACDAIHLPRVAREKKEDQIKEQLAERARLESLPRSKQTYEEFKAEMAARGMPIDGKKITAAFTEGEVKKIAIEEFKKRHNLTDEQWDAIPGSPCNGDWDNLVATHRK